ncbi:MAG: hypothetical protein IMF09_10300 [Proteobacteria bacterium]|nr:hypothetical protein [Pseudomonadota bacterium]
MNKSTKPLKYVAFPEICDVCGKKLIRMAAEADSETNQLLHHCPHRSTVVLMTLDEIEGTKAITKWIIESPCSEERAINLATELAEKMGAEMVVNHTGRLQ